MTRNEFLDKMLTLERAINDLHKSLEDELMDITNNLSTEEWLLAHSAVELAKGITYTKLAISNIHNQVYGEKLPHTGGGNPSHKIKVKHLILTQYGNRNLLQTIQ